MTPLSSTVARHPHPVSKLLQVARHRVVRWFRPTEADVLRRRIAVEPHPHPTIGPVDRKPMSGAHQ